jgi:hypothetical protein
VLEQHSTAAAIARSKKRQQRSKKQKAVDNSSSTAITTALAVTVATLHAVPLSTDIQTAGATADTAATAGAATADAADTSAGAGTAITAITAIAATATAGGAERVALCWVAVHAALALTVSETVELLKSDTPEGESPTTKHNAKRVRSSSTRNSAAAAVKTIYEKCMDAVQTLVPDVVSAEQVSTNIWSHRYSAASTAQTQVD